jgi:hypothetical protein
MSDIHSMKIIDTAGNPQGLIVEEGALVTIPYDSAISQGLITGDVPFARYGRCTVSNTAMDVVTWNAAYVFPATAGERMRVVGGANDTTTGSGAGKVKIDYLDDTNAAQTEEVTLTGATPVNTTATKIRRVNRVYVSALGSANTTGVCAGPINVYHLTNAAPIYG